MRNCLYWLGPLLVFVIVCRFASAQVYAPVNIYWPTNSGAKCVDINSLPNGSVPAICYNYLTYSSIYIDELQTVREEIGRLLLSNSWTSPDCVVAGLRIGCPYMFRPCFEVPIPGQNATVAVGGYLCRELCVATYNACYAAVVEALESTGQADVIPQATTCDPPWSNLYGHNVYGVPQYPPSYVYQVPVSLNYSTNVTWWSNLTCYYGNQNATTAVPATICPAGMYYSSDNGGGTCALNCPEPVLSASEFDAVQGVAVAFGWVSFVVTVIMLGSLLLEYKKRTFPHDLFIYFTVCLILLALSFVVGSAGYRNIDCSNSHTPNTWGAGACTIQGTLYVYTSLASVFWWLVIAFNYFLLVVMGYKSKPLMEWRQWWWDLIDSKGFKWRCWFRWETIYILYHVFAWGVPLLIIIIALAAHRIGYGGHDIWCTIYSGSDSLVYWPKSNLALKHAGGDPWGVWHIVLFDVPISVAICLGCGFLLAVLVVGVKNHKGRILTWDFIKEHFRLTLFMGIFFWVYVFELAFQFEQSSEREAQYDAYDDYINCSFESVLLSETVGTSVPCVLTRTVSFPLWVMMAINVAAQGLMAFIILGTTRVLLCQLIFFATILPVYLGWMAPRSLNGYDEDVGVAEEVGGDRGGGDPVEGGGLSSMHDDL